MEKFKSWLMYGGAMILFLIGVGLGMIISLSLILSSMPAGCFK